MASTFQMKKTFSVDSKTELLKAFAHPARLIIVQTLVKGEKCVCELQKLVGTEMSTVSRHLSVLKNAGVVIGEKRAQQIIYSLACPCIEDFLDSINQLCKDKFEREMKKM